MKDMIKKYDEIYYSTYFDANYIEDNGEVVFYKRYGYVIIELYVIENCNLKHIGSFTIEGYKNLSDKVSEYISSKLIQAKKIVLL